MSIKEAAISVIVNMRLSAVANITTFTKTWKVETSYD